MGAYHNPKIKPTLNAGTDVNMLRRLLIACTLHYYNYMFRANMKDICEQHKKECGKNLHVKGCTRENKNTFCYEVAKQSLDLCSKSLEFDVLSDILEANCLGPRQIDINQIIGDRHCYEDMISKVHFNALCFLSDAMVRKSQSVLPKFEHLNVMGEKGSPCPMCEMKEGRSLDLIAKYKKGLLCKCVYACRCE